jgi:autotransporter-associated beta strand protein
LRFAPVALLTRAATLLLSAQLASAMDMRFDVATYAGNASGNSSDGNQDWFNTGQMAALNFPSANGHQIDQGGSSHLATLQAQGNSLGVYYDTFDNFFTDSATATQPSAASVVSTIQSWIKSNFGGSTETNSWLVLNEVSSTTWTDTTKASDGNTIGNDYRIWLVNAISALHTAGYNNIILYVPNSVAGNSANYKNTWASITADAYVGDEAFIDGQVVAADNYSVATLQASYQAMFNSWTQTAGVAAAKLIAGEHFSVNAYAPATYWGADGLSGTSWEMAIEARDLAIHNIPFGGFIGYAWDKDAQATGNSATDLANQVAYEKAYASTMVVQTEVPAWTGNDGTASWNDYLNWTGGLASTVSAPYPLLASTNPNLPKQTTANFLNAITTPTTITLDGNQSISTLSFGNADAYTIAPGTGGSLTLAPTSTAPNPSITVTLGSHSITASIVLAGNLALNLTGNLTLSGSLTDSGYAITKSGTGTLTISGTENYSGGSTLAIALGTLNLNSDAGSATSAPLALSASSGAILFNSQQHLASLALNGGYAAMLTRGKYLLTHSLSISNNGTLDLTENDLIDDYSGASPLANIQAALASGYSHGTWNGNGIVSSSTISHPGTSLGFAEASDVLGLSGSATGTFDGQTVDATTVLVKYTWMGDANLDGIVDASDLSRISPTGTIWAAGDFNYDSVVNADDYALFALGDIEQQGNISTLTPEPMLLLGLLIPMVSRRRSVPQRNVSNLR